MTKLRLTAGLAATLLATSASAVTYLGSDLANLATFPLQQPQVVGTSLFFDTGLTYARPKIMDLALPALPAGTEQVKLRIHITRTSCSVDFGCINGQIDEDFFIGLGSGQDYITAGLGDYSSTLSGMGGHLVTDYGTDTLFHSSGPGINVTLPPAGGTYVLELTYALSGSGTQLDMAIDSFTVSYSTSVVLNPANLHLALVRDNDRGERYQIDWVELETEGGETPVAVDIKPGSCPNPLNAGSAKGVVSVAVSGNADVAVNSIDPASVRLAGVAPLGWTVADVATPYAPFTGKQNRLDCVAAGGDGASDLVFKFDKDALVAALGGAALVDDATVVLPLTGSLYDGNTIVGEDVMWVIKKK